MGLYNLHPFEIKTSSNTITTFPCSSSEYDPYSTLIVLNDGDDDEMNRWFETK